MPSPLGTWSGGGMPECAKADAPALNLVNVAETCVGTKALGPASAGGLGPGMSLHGPGFTAPEWLPRRHVRLMTFWTSPPSCSLKWRCLA